MIYDTMENISRYKIMTSDIKEFLTKKEYTEGRFELKNGVFATVSRCQTKGYELGKFESHIKYIDVQCVLSGEEMIEITTVDGLKEIEPYDAERDLVFFHNGNEEQIIKLKMFAGTFSVIYPNEAHKSGIHLKNLSKIIKIVVKIPI